MTLKNLTIQLADLSDYLVIIVAVLSLLTIRRNGYFRLLSAYLFSLSALNIATAVTANYGMNNSYLYHAIGCAELLFTFLLYRRIGLSSVWDGVFLIVFSVYIADSLYLVINGLREINSIGQSVCMLFIIVLGINFLWKLYKEEKVEHLGRYPYFYINAGFTIFASGAFFVYLLIARLSYKEIPDESFYYSWLIIPVFVTIKFILIPVGIFMERKYAK